MLFCCGRPVHGSKADLPTILQKQIELQYAKARLALLVQELSLSLGWMRKSHCCQTRHLNKGNLPPPDWKICTESIFKANTASSGACPSLAASAWNATPGELVQGDRTRPWHDHSLVCGSPKGASRRRSKLMRSSSTLPSLLLEVVFFGAKWHFGLPARFKDH